MPRCSKARIIVAPAAGAIGTPFGSFELWSQATGSATLKSGASLFTSSQDSTIPSRLLAAIAAARAAGTTLIPMLTGGAAERYINKVVGAGTAGSPWLWDINYWKHGNPETVGGGGLLWPDGTGMDRYNLPIYTDAVASAVEDKVIIGIDIYDEPQASGHRIPAGPSGTTRQQIDDMVAYAKGIFGVDLPVGLSCKTDYFAGGGDSAYNYVNLDFMTTSYIQNFGDCATWRNSRLSEAAAFGIKLNIAYNVLHGGAGFGETAASCALVSPPDNLPTGGLRPGTDRCYQGPEQLQQFCATLLAPDGSGRKAAAFSQWTYESAYYNRAESQAAFAVNAALCAARTTVAGGLHR